MNFQQTECGKDMKAVPCPRDETFGFGPLSLLSLSERERSCRRLRPASWLRIDAGCAIGRVGENTRRPRPLPGGRKVGIGKKTHQERPKRHCKVSFDPGADKNVPWRFSIVDAAQADPSNSAVRTTPKSERIK
jgi:hypothetical protein